jgi:putative protease
MSAHPHRRPEILAPAGSPEALAAALAHGADAVYFGLQDGFNARARAVNFTTSSTGSSRGSTVPGPGPT